jgi:hypothetical protein
LVVEVIGVRREPGEDYGRQREQLQSNQAEEEEHRQV